MLGRSAYSGITILRFFRLRIVAPVKRRTSARYFYLASAVIAAANIAAIASSFDLRSAESSLPPVKAGQTVSRATPEIKRLREQDRLISFGAFMITTVASVATDLLFYHAIVTSRTSVQSNVSSVPKTVKWQIFRPYIPALLASILYFICLQLSFFDPMIPSIVFATITLGKLVPAIDTIIFFRFSIEQTKTLLKSLSSSNSRPRAASGGEGRGNAPAGNVFPLFPVQQPSASARSNHATVGPVGIVVDPNPLKPHAVGHGWYGADHSPPHRPTRQVDLNINTDMRQPPLSPTYSTAPTTPAVTPRTTSFLLSPLSPRSDQNGTGQDRQYRLNKQ
ncbi:hypothetical protein BCR44DRAFT_1426491 [Catenaria anguillulae PL171]|uniref:Uncharacterized protein n=1 Tax=Catenaria anguillulae PL171 TaxID=765915 RepID=A0A1Y2I0A5_9FUNG|nr:hypothetical protein BCR44DRAFT_1426491 [Catenaria anguillulae PL171]